MPTITIRLTEQQKAQVEEAADLAMVSVSEFVRSALMVCTDNIESRMAQLADHERRLAEIEHHITRS